MKTSNPSPLSGWSSRFLVLVALLVGLFSRAALAQDDLQDPPEYPVEPSPGFALIVPADLRVPTCNAAGVVVNYPLPKLWSDCATPGAVVCEPTPGSVFPVGETVVTCSVANDCGERTNRTFTISVVLDTQPPVITCPTNLLAYAPNAAGVVVDYPLPTVTDDADPSPALEFTPPPGSVFTPGETTVTLKATDACGRVATCTFKVEVHLPELQARRVQVPDAAGGPAKPGLSLTPVGLDGFDVTADLNDGWEPATNNGPFQMAFDLKAAQFFRPPTLGGVYRGPQSEIAYVQVGLLRAYETPGVSLLRTTPDDSTEGGVTLLSGTAGGGGAVNVWSGPQNLPFKFYFFGRPYTQFRVSKNGLLTFSTNIVTGQEGLNYFNFTLAQTTNVMVSPLPLWNQGFPVDNTIFCMAGRFTNQTSADNVTGFLYGDAPKRQVWVLFRHPKDGYGQTRTAVVLEEGSNRIYLMDMDSDVPATSASRLLAGIQGAPNSTREVRQVPVGPFLQLAATNWSRVDNGCYLFKPYELGFQVNGLASPEITAATNLNALVAEQMRRFNIPGCTVAISRNGRLIFNRGYGYANVEKNETMKPSHRACIGSVSKVLAAIGVEKLIQLGQLNGLTDWAYAPNRLGGPWFWAGVNQGITNNVYTNFGNAVALQTLTNINLRHLLSHTAALNRPNDDVGAANAYASGIYTNLTARDHVRWFAATQPHLTNNVARRRTYSNPSFKQIGVLIEEVAGQPFEQWMMANIVVPGGAPFMRLMRTYEHEETWRDARRYHDYSTNGPWTTSRITGEWGPRPYADAKYDNAADGAAGSWTGTAADLVRLLAALDGLPNKPDLLATNRIAELESVAFPGLHATQGIGWDSASATRVEKNGNIGYGSAHLMRATTPDRLTVAVVANSGAGVTGLAQAIFSAVQPLPNVSPLYDLFPAQLMEP